jgi:hypothetical protein
LSLFFVRMTINDIRWNVRIIEKVMFYVLFNVTV